VEELAKMKEDLKNKVIGKIEEKGIKPKSKSSIRNKKLAEMVFLYLWQWHLLQ
jgi:hypothetical protein